MSVKINTFHIENVKKVKAVVMQPSSNGLTVIGGKNGEGKTSILDTIAFALGGNRKAPTNLKREGSMSDPEMSITLSNGIRVERSGKNTALKVIDEHGAKAGQNLLNSFIEELALDLPKFMIQSDAEKSKTLLGILGIGEELTNLDRQEKELFEKRHAIGQIADSKKKHASELPEYPNVPDEPVTAGELIKQQQAILAKNGENQRKRDQIDNLEQQQGNLEEQVESLKQQLAEKEERLAQVNQDLATAKKSTAQLQDESTVEIENKLNEIETINMQVRANMDKEKALDEANRYQEQYQNYTTEIEKVRADRLKLLDTANLPLPDLSVKDAQLLYKDKAWDCMSSAEQLKVAVAIVRELNPECGFVLIDKLEQMDLETMQEFGQWLEAEGLQAIATRVSTGDECSIIIEDGLPQGLSYLDVINTETTTKKDEEWSW